MNSGTLFLWLFLLLFSTGKLTLHAQSRQPDSLRNKQLAYNMKLKEEADRKKLEENKKKVNKPGPAVVAYDSKGNKIESGVAKDGAKVTTTTIVIPPVLNRKFNSDTINTDSVLIRVLKVKQRLQVYYKGRLLTAYKCVFGPTPMLPKQCEGDRCTPEGTFTIQNCKDHHKWDKFMLIDYPNEEARRAFEEKKRKGLLPHNANIGGLIGIHGVWLNGDNVIDMKHNWTDGCISLKNADVEELSRIIKPGVTKITILK